MVRQTMILLHNSALAGALHHQAFHDGLTGLANRACSPTGWSTRWPCGRTAAANWS